MKCFGVENREKQIALTLPERLPEQELLSLLGLFWLLDLLRYEFIRIQFNVFF